jgi:hypothetical protein
MPFGRSRVQRAMSHITTRSSHSRVSRTACTAATIFFFGHSQVLRSGVM